MKFKITGVSSFSIGKIEDRNVPVIGKSLNFLRGRTEAEMTFSLKRETPNSNGDTFDLPYVVEGPAGEVLERGVFTGCYIKHVSYGEIDPNVMTVEPVEPASDRVLPFEVP